MKDELGFIKIAGAVLATALIITGLQNLTDGLYGPKPAAKAGYAIAVAEETAGGAEPADNPPDWGTVLPTADVNAGQQQSTKCQSCHTFTKGGMDMTGPNNYGVIGRKPGTKPGFAFSSGMTDFGKTIAGWDYDHLYMFLKNPQGYVSGTKMTFAGIKSPQDRINLIAWLRQQSDSPAPIPAPNPKKAAAEVGPSSAPAVTGKPGAAPGAVAGGKGAEVGAGGAAGTQTPSSGAAAAPSATSDVKGQTTSTANKGGKG
jgi:cytochrome c